MTTLESNIKSEPTATTAVGVLDLFTTSRTGIDVFSDQLVASVKNGETSALKVRVWIKSMEEILDRVNKETKDEQKREADKYPEASFDFAGATITKAAVKTEYDYKDVQDPVYWRIFDIASRATKQLKDRETFLKSVNGSMTIVDEESGEVVTIHAPVKKTTDGLKVSIK